MCAWLSTTGASCVMAGDCDWKVREANTGAEAFLRVLGGGAFSQYRRTMDGLLRIYGNLSLLEMAPVLLAAREIHPGKAVIEHGSVMALWGEASDIASLRSFGRADLATNSETQ